MPCQKIPGQCKCRLDVTWAGIGTTDQERRQSHQSVLVRRGGVTADRTPGFWGYMCKTFGYAGHGTSLQIEPEPQFLKQIQFEPRKVCAQIVRRDVGVE